MQNITRQNHMPTLAVEDLCKPSSHPGIRHGRAETRLLRWNACTPTPVKVSSNLLGVTCGRSSQDVASRNVRRARYLDLVSCSIQLCLGRGQCLAGPCSHALCSLQAPLQLQHKHINCDLSCSRRINVTQGNGPLSRLGSVTPSPQKQ